jgi:hypothetical protein
MTFTRRCRNQETSHLEDDPLFLFFFFEMDQIWATCQMIKEREEFREWSNCFKRPAR